MVERRMTLSTDTITEEQVVSLRKALAEIQPCAGLVTIEPAVSFEESILARLEAVKGDIYVLYMDKPLPLSARERARELFNRLHEEGKLTKPVIALDTDLRLEGLKLFSFDIALRLLKDGHKVQRVGWQGYLYMENGIIKHSVNNREYRPTQKAILASNWRIV